MLREMSSSQFTEWVAYYQEWPPDEADYYRTGIIASTIHNTSRTKSSQRAAEPEDFMPKKPAKEKQSTSEMLKRVQQINHALGGTDARS